MRVIYLHQYFTPPHMAGGTRSYSLAKRLVAKGHVVHMITTDRESTAKSRDGEWRCSDESGISVHWTPVPYDNAMSVAQRLGAFLRFSWRAACKAAELDGEVVFATSTPLTIALPGVYAAKRRRVPLVFEVRDLWPAVPISMGALRNPVARWGARWLERFAYQNSAQVVTLAPGMKDAIAETGYPADRITVIPNGADAEIVSSRPSAPTQLREARDWLGVRKLVLYCGAIGKANGVSYLVHVAAEVRKLDPEIRFAVIGAGAEGEMVRDAAASCGILDETLFMLGKMPKREVADWLHACDLTMALFTGPRIVWKDATQNKFFDSLAAGKPVACNFDGWQCRIAAEKGVGFVLPADDVERAARDLVARLADADWMRAAAIAARELAATRFSMDTLADRLEAVLKRAIAAES